MKSAPEANTPGIKAEGVRRVREWKRELRVAAFVSAVALCFLIFRLVDILSFDLLFLVRPQPKLMDEIALIYMDDSSRLALQQPHDKEWNRAVHADLIKKLTRYGAKALVFDVLFEGTNNPPANAALVQAAKENGRVIVAAQVNRAGKAGGVKWHLESEPFAELQEVTAFGAVESPDTRLHYRDPGIGIPSLAARAVEIALGRTNSEAGERWLNYYPPGALPWHSYHEVLNDPPSSATSLAASLSNKVVFVGSKSGIGPGGRIGTDDHATPYTLWTRLNSPGVDVIATAYLNLARQEWLSRLPRSAEIALVIGLALLLPISLRRLSPVNASIASVALMAIAFGITAFAAHKFHLWFPWLIISGVEVPCALACVLILKVQRATTEFSRSTAALAATAESAPSGAGRTRVVDPAAAGDAMVVPDYNLIRSIGSGAYGQVWLAQGILGGYRAVKIISRKQFEDARPFDREFEGIKHFEPISRKHAGFVHILHAGRGPGGDYFFYVMELADDIETGAKIVPESYSPRTLSGELTRRSLLPVRECVELGIQLSGALSFLHNEGLIHRDIKPGNIVYSGGKPRFVDIGLVTAVGNARTWVGTEGYFPPEGTGSPPGDIYSLGKTLYRAWSGFAVDRFPDVPTEVADSADLPMFQRLNRIILKACETDPALRYRTAAELHNDLVQLARATHGVSTSLRAGSSK